MKRIAYVELDTHAEIASNFRNLILDSKIIQADFYFSRKVSDILGLTGQPDVIISSPEDIHNQLVKGRYDLVIIGTAHRYFCTYYLLCSQFKTAIICHNLNFSRTGKMQLLLNIFKKETIYRLKLLLKEGLSLAPKLYAESKKLVLEKKLVEENSDMELRYIPFFFNQENAFLADNKEVISVLIPGTVSQSRRDYLRIFKIISEIGPGKKFHFTFLGRAAAEELLAFQKLERALPQGITLEYFVEKVPQNLFAAHMRGADVLWCPLHRETEFFSVTEIYGVTKMSGGVGDAVTFGKLAIFPTFYKTDNPYIFPENEDVTSQFEALAKKKHFERTFNKKQVLQELEATIFSLL